jgi:hypothetical protein
MTGFDAARLSVESASSIPLLFGPASRDRTPGRTGEITTREGQTLAQRFRMRSGSFGRYSHSGLVAGFLSSKCGFATLLDPRGGRAGRSPALGALRRIDGIPMRDPSPACSAR